jgi:uncharacterized protein YndB with AHSA1/START domain
MPHEFEVRSEIELDATPEQVWEAIASGPGIDSWFMGRNQVEPREGGMARMTIAGATEENTVTVWEPPHRFASRSSTGEDGSFMAIEYLIEGRDGGGTVLRLVHSGVMSADDWAAEYDALKQGWDMYLLTLAHYLSYFPGRTATPVSAWGPQQADGEHVWAGLKRGLGLTGKVTEGDRARFTLQGSTPVEGSSTPSCTRASLACAPATRCTGSSAGTAWSAWATTSSPTTPTRTRPSVPGRPGSPSCSPSTDADSRPLLHARRRTPAPARSRRRRASGH